MEVIKSTARLLVLIILNIVAHEKAHVLVKQWEHCKTNANYDFMYNVSITTIKDKQYADAEMFLRVHLDNNIRSHVVIEILTGQTFTHLLDINETKSCEAFHKYFGEFAYELERKGQLIPGMCPIPKGRHYVHNFYIDFRKITTFVNFPFGYLRYKLNAYDNKNRLLTCLKVEVDKQL